MHVPKIVGIEQEYGILDSENKESNPVNNSFLIVNSLGKECDLLWDYNSESPSADARGFVHDIDDFQISDSDNARINNILTNGARFYVDHAHPEYSTPECTNAHDLVACDKAGELIINECQKRIEEKFDGKKILIYKNNTDNKGNSYGCHENYLMSKKCYEEIFENGNSNEPSEIVGNILIPFFVTRQIFCGSGKVGSEFSSEPVDYQISQRADFFETLIDGNTTHHRPIINTRDEPHSDREKFRRLHVIVGDANMSEYSTYLKVGTTQLVLLMLEDKFFKVKLSLYDPIKAIKAVSRDLTCRKKLQLSDGSYLTPIEIQEEFLNAAKRYIKTLPEEEFGLYPDIINKWEFVLSSLSENPLLLNDKIDWIIKKHLLERYMQKKNWNWKTPQILMMSIIYHDIDRKSGLYYILEKEGRVERIIKDEALIKRYIEHAPEDTRAYFRSEALKMYRNYIASVNWDRIKFDIGENKLKTIPLMDPTKGTKDKVEKLFKKKLDIRDFIKELEA
jgi:Pup amidohydrolase